MKNFVQQIVLALGIVLTFATCSSEKEMQSYEFSAIPNALKISMEECSKTIAVTSQAENESVDFDIARYPNWVSITKQSNGITVNFTENDLNGLRSGEIALKQKNSRDSIVIPIVQSAVVFSDSATNAAVSDNSQILIDKDFSTTGSGTSEVKDTQIGFTTGNESCGTSLISDTEAFDYTETYYHDSVLKDTILIHYHDVGINPLCDMGMGAFVLFNKRATTSRTADPYLLTNELSGVSVVQFSVSATSLEGRGLALYASVGGGDFEPIGIFMPSEINTEQTYTVSVNLKNVRLKFAPLGKSGYMRLHNLKVYSPTFVHDGGLIINENFQSWTREGFIELDSNTSGSCDALMSSTNVMYAQRPINSTKAYDKWTVSWGFYDYAVNPTCGNDAGTSTGTSDVSTGYFEIQAPLYYECGLHMSNGNMTTSVLPSVSKVQFSISYTETGYDYVNGIVLWKKGKSDSSWEKVGSYSIDGTMTDKIKGKIFEANINEGNVQLRFSPRFPFLNGVDITPDHASNSVDINDASISALIVKNFSDPQINRAVRIHDLKVWCMNKQ